MVVRHAEVLTRDGKLATEPLRSAKATDTYVLAGGDEVVLEPSLTFHGFRYAEVTGAGGARTRSAVVVGSDLRRTGWFECSHELLNRFHENVVWSMRGNFLDVPTDCPQRDERLGWTGDAQVFAPDRRVPVRHRGLLHVLAGRPRRRPAAGGAVPWVIPDVIGRHAPAAAGWGDAATIVPVTLYERTGDRELLERQLPSMRAWVDHIACRRAAVDRAASSSATGSTPTRRPDAPNQAKADPDVVATAYLARSASAGRPRSTSSYAELAADVRVRAFARAYVSPEGRVQSDCPTVYALALAFDLMPDRGAAPASRGTGWPRSCAPPATGSAPASSARR